MVKTPHGLVLEVILLHLWHINVIFWLDRILPVYMLITVLCHSGLFVVIVCPGWMLTSPLLSFPRRFLSRNRCSDVKIIRLFCYECDKSLGTACYQRMEGTTLLLANLGAFHSKKSVVVGGQGAFGPLW